MEILKTRGAFVVVALFLSTILTFWQLPGNGFVQLDDQDYITQNPHIRAGLTWEGIRWAMSSREISNYGHPLTWISHMIDVQLFGLRPAGHHIMNLVFHVANTLLLLFLLRGMTGVLWKSACVAFLFALHPLHVEPVAWASERKEVLSAFFSFLTLLAYVRYRHKPVLSRYWPVPILFSLALAAKPMAVTLPFLLLLLEIWPLGRLQRIFVPSNGFPAVRLRSPGVRLALEMAPLFALTVISSVIAASGQPHEGMIKSVDDYSIGLRLQSAVVAYVAYLLKTVWPVGLAFPNSHPGAFPVWQVGISLLFLLLISGLVIAARRRFPFLPVGWFWYLGVFVPVIGLVQIHDFSMADRYTYLPLIGFFVALVWGGGRLIALRPGLRAPSAALTITLLAVLATLSARQTGFWRDAETLFTHAVHVSSGNYLAEYNLGSVLTQNGKLAAAVPHYREALRIRPNYTDAHNNLGYALLELGSFAEAKTHFLTAIRQRPKDVEAYNNMGAVLLNEGRYEEALGYLKTVIRLQPLLVAGHNNLGFALFSLGKKDEAVAHYREALRLDPTDQDARYNLEQTFAKP